jgi:hypothetical protein
VSSYVTATPLLSAPAAATAPTVADANSAWANSAWIQLIASTSGTTALAGISLRLTAGSYSAAEAEIDLGTGGAGSEVVVSTIRLALPNSGAGSWHTYLLPVPVGGVAASTRIAGRIRVSVTGVRTWSLGLAYYTGLSTDQQVTTSTPLACVPAAAAGVTVTPSASAWADSAWVQLTAGLGAAIGIAGVTCQNPWAVDLELDLGTGGAGSEVVITTLRTTFTDASQGRFLWADLPGLFPVAASTRIAVRLRKAGTSVTTAKVALVYYDGVTSGPAAVTSTGSIAFGKPALAGTGSVAVPAVTSTGSITIARPALAGTGTAAVPAITSTGSVVFGKPALAAVGAQTDPVVLLTMTRPTCATATAQLITLTGTHFPASPVVTLTDPHGLTFTPAILTATSTVITVTAVFLVCGTWSVTVSGSNVLRIATSHRVSTRRLRQFPLPASPSRAWVFCRQLDILVQAGIGNTVAPGDDPQIQLEVSRDGGQVWSPARTVSAGRIGAYTRRARVRHLGRYRMGGVARLVVTDPVPWAFLRATAQLETGGR